MTQFNKTTRQLLFEARFQTSKQETQRLKQEFANLRKEMSQVDDANERSARSSREATQERNREAASVRRTADEYDRLAREKRDAAAVKSNDRLTGVADFGARGSAIAGAFAGGTEFANVLGLLDDATTAFVQFGVVGAASAVAIGAVSLAFAEFTRQAEEAKQRVEEYITAQRDLNEAIAAGATTGDLRDRRDRLQEQLDAIGLSTGRYTDILTRYQTAINEAYDRNQGLLAQAQLQIELFAVQESFNRQTSELTRGQIATIGELNTAVENEIKQQAALEAQIELVNYAIENGQTAQADAAANATALEARIREIATALTAEATATEQSSEALRTRHTGLVTERRELEAAVEWLRERASADNNYNQIASNLQTTVNELTDAIARNTIAFRQAQAREQAAGLAKEYTDLTNAIAKNKAALKELREAGTAAYDALLESIAKIEADANEARAKALADAAEAQSEAYLDHLESLAQIEKRAYRDIQDAVANRDAIAFVRAKQARQDAIDEEQKSYAKRERELQKSLDKQLQQIQDNADKAIRAQRDQYYKESALRVQQYQQILADQTLLQQRLNLINQIGLNNAESAATQYWTTAEKLANDALVKLLTISAINPIGFGTSMNGTGGGGIQNALGSMMTQVARSEIRATLRGALRG